MLNNTGIAAMNAITASPFTFWMAKMFGKEKREVSLSGIAVIRMWRKKPYLMQFVSLIEFHRSEKNGITRVWFTDK